jgi:predicted RND superfamily exporter protein
MSFLKLLPTDLKSMLYVEERRQTIMTVRMADTGIAKYRPVFDRLEQKFAELQTDHAGFAASFSGLTYFRARELYTVVSDLAKSLGTAALIIFIVLAFVYRSIRIGLISIIPNMFPLVVTATVLRLTGGSLDFASACAFTVCLGIAVDDTIHFLTRFRQEQLKTSDQLEAVRKSFIGVGTALVTTTVILVVGFSTALTSNLPDHRMFAAMACATISSALLGDLLFLPAMLVYFRPRRKVRLEVHRITAHE